MAIFFSPELNNIVIFGFPFGYYMGAQGSLIIFVILIFWYTKKMNANDDKYGVAGSWKQLSRQMDSIQGAYRSPFASWRFYRALPMPHQVICPIDKHQHPCPQFTRAWFTSMKNLTLGQMVTAAIALKRYEAVIIANTTGELPLPDKQACLDWIKSGKGFVGMHSATDTFHNFKPYIEMIGGEFRGHGAQVGVDAINQDNECPACRHLPGNWPVFDEIYLFKNFDLHRGGDAAYPNVTVQTGGHQVGREFIVPAVGLAGAAVLHGKPAQRSQGQGGQDAVVQGVFLLEFRRLR